MRTRRPIALALPLVLALVAGAALAVEEEPSRGPKELAGLRYRLVGPPAGGRVSRVAGVPGDPLTYYVAGANGGIIKTMAKKTTKVVEAKPDHNSAPTGDVKIGNAGGYKKGGATKKHFATGGVVDSGRPVAMPKKAPSKPVAISHLSGTFKKGGKVAC